MDLIIRRAVQSDALTLSQLRVASWRAAYAGIISDDFLAAMDAQADAPKYKLGPDDMPNFIAELNGLPIGFIVLSASRDEDMKESAELQAMYLLPDYWGHGYGKELMRFTLNMLKEKNYPSVYLWVLQKNTRARRFYEAAGFQEDGASQTLEIEKPLELLRYFRICE